VAGSKPKGVAQQLFEAQQRRAAHKAALEKAARAAEEKEKRAAARREAAAARQAQRAAEDLAKRQQAADARQVQQVLREMEKRETLRQQAEAREALARERDAAREERGRAVRQLKAEAAERTAEVERRVRAIGSILTDRDRGLEPLEARSDAGADAEATTYSDRIARTLAERSFLKRAHPDVSYSPDARRLTVVVDLPRTEGVPTDKAFRYVAAQNEIVAVPRREAEIQSIYRDAVARLALCVTYYAAALTTAEAVEVIAVNGHVRSTDPATGQPIRLCLVSLLVDREVFESVALDEPRLAPVQCLEHLKARLSENAYNLQPVIPFVDPAWDRDHGRTSEALDLSTMDPYDFERLIRDLFLAMGFTAWRTPDSHDGGVDAVAVRDDIAIGGVCVIQAKRYAHTVPVEAVRALYGTMQAQKAYTGLVVTTSSFGPASHAFAAEVGRITLIDGPRLRALIKEHLGRDTVISARRTAP
jgi:restriction system protein